MNTLLDRLSRLPIPLKIVLSFAVVILVGSLLLSLPISQAPTSEATYFDHLFTAVSMVCVTGLYTQPVATTYSLFGQIINILLIQLGGLGLITIVAAVVMRMGRRVSVRDELTLKEALNRNELTDFRRFLVSVVKYTLLIEAFGMGLLSLHFIPELGLQHGLFTSLYLSVSAFNNAGFDNLGTLSMQLYVDTPLITFALSTLVILGGLGFTVWFDIGRTFRELAQRKDWKNFRHYYRKLRLHSQLVLNWTVLLLAVGTLLFLAAEWNNPDTIGQLDFDGKLQASFFQSMTTRTAGFGSIDFTQIHTVSMVFLTVLMFIGGSPGGTAGGAKTATIALALMLVSSEIRGQDHVNYKNHTIPKELVRRALVVVVAFIGIFFIGVLLLALFEPEATLGYLIFEVVSSMATVGVTANLTPELSWMSQTVIMFLMFIGRLGPITIFTALSARQKKKKDITYATGKILIG
ncbi:TrkH family potassium uptake protein [Atopococcus tabaci]|uniref:TrkH family potassium uptake protein n=2 Tax=Atopococcus tabaci TaxID=269774 RepID=UPI00240A4F09|nr:potassium transporter TrkG [Atopococcus tabaci]